MTLPAGLDSPASLDSSVRQLDRGRVLLGGDGGRLIRLPSAAALPALLERGGGRLVAAGMAHPRPRRVPSPDVTVVIPVLDRAEQLDRCLASVGDAVPVLVVDDGSKDAGAVARVAALHGARVLRLPENVGPGAARNAGAAAVSTSLVAFLDSDCIAPPGWLSELSGHFDDPSVAAVAPRVRSTTTPGLLGAYAAARGPLDMGPAEGRVRPGGRVPYVPTAALLVRRKATSGEMFDAALRFGEDVDLVWRLHDRGWKVRYDPRIVVLHSEPADWATWLSRRHAYGTSAAPLARRHGGRLTPLVLPPWPSSSVALLLLGRPVLALATASASAARIARQLHACGLSSRESAGTAARITAQATASVAAGLGGPGTAATGPVLLAGLALARTRRSAALALLGPPLLEWVQRRPRVGPVRWTTLRLLDDLAYATGVWRGCWRHRSAAALWPSRQRPT